MFDLPDQLFDKYNRKVAVHYALYDSRRIIHYGTSKVCGKISNKNTIHAEELALRQLYFIGKKRKNIKNINILIWRYDKNIKPKQTFCCSACTKLIKKHKYQNKIFTINNNNKLEKAIIKNPKPSLAIIIKNKL